MAIVDWYAKREAMCEELSQDTHMGLFTLALKKQDDMDRLYSVIKAQQKWDKSTPKLYMDEVSKFCEILFGSSSIDVVAFFIDSPIVAFKERIEASRQARGLCGEPTWYAEPVHTLTALDQDRIHSFRESVRARKLDQRLYYLNADSAEVWHELINAGDYCQYDWCRDSLKALVRSKEWAAAVSAGQHDTFVMLAGGGSASKDVEILSAIVDSRYRANAGQKTSYLLVDISQHMLSASMTRIKRYFRRQPIADSLVHVGGIVADMLALGQIKSRLRRTGSKNAWFLTGGTIGNLSERAVLSTIESVAEPGDLLAIGIDTYDPKRREEARKAILAKYSPEMMQDFLHTPIGVLVRHLERDLSTAAVRKSIKPDVVDGRLHGYSDLDNALTAEVRLDFGKDDMFTLLTSTRYDEAGFVAWLVDRGWEKIETFRSADPESTFRQIFVRRANAKRTTRES